jgi:exosortase/archaeosortase family protein
MFLRYALILIVAIPNLWIFYLIFTPLTLYVSYFLLDIFFSATVSGSTILINNCAPIEFINACAAGSAYYLLFLLNLSTPKLKSRITALAFSFSAFFLLNITRIFILSLLFINNSQIFDAAHKFSWYTLSIIFVVGIWFLTVKLFSVKQVPFYTDLKFLYKKSIFSD